MARFSISITDKTTVEQIEAMRKSLGLSLSRYFRDLHTAYFKKRVEGVEIEAFVDTLREAAGADEGREPLGEPIDAPPGYKAVYLSEGVYDRFERWRLKSEDANPDAPRGYDAAITRAMNDLCGPNSWEALREVEEAEAADAEKLISGTDWDNF